MGTLCTCSRSSRPRNGRHTPRLVLLRGVERSVTIGLPLYVDYEDEATAELEMLNGQDISTLDGCVIEFAKVEDGEITMVVRNSSGTIIAEIISVGGDS